MLDNLFEDSGDKIKYFAKILFILGCIPFLIIGFWLVFIHNDVSQNIFFGVKILGMLILMFGPLVSYFSALLLYGFGELVSNSLFVPHSTSIVAENKTEQQENRNYEKVVAAEKPKVEHNAPAAESIPVPKQEQETKKVLRKTADTTPSKTAGLGEHLNYALQYSTDDGMKRYLNGVLEKLSTDEQQELNAILAAPLAKLRTTVNDYLSSKKEE